MKFKILFKDKNIFHEKKYISLSEDAPSFNRRKYWK